MKRWSLRLWIACGAALLSISVVTVFAGLVTIQRRSDAMEEISDRIRTAGQAVQNRVQKNGTLESSLGEIRAVETVMPGNAGGFHFQMESPPGTIVYQSPALKSLPKNELADGQISDFQIGNGIFRVGAFLRGNTRLLIACEHSFALYRIQRLIFRFFATGLVVALLAGAGGWCLVARGILPVEKLTEAAEQITERNLHQRLPTQNQPAEIQRLAEVLNRVFDRLEASFTQIQRFTSDASHELKTPLTIIRGEIQMALCQEDFDSEQRRVLSSLFEETERLSAIVEGLLLLTRADAGRFQFDLKLMDLSEEVQPLLEDMQIIAEGNDQRIESTVTPHVMVNGNGQFLRQLLLNLFDNALKYGDRGGRIMVRVEATEKDAIFTISNTGRGIPPDKRPHVFDRFFRCAPARSSQPRGHGLGLAICREIARVHKGDLTLEESEPGWTTFRLALRLVKTAA